MSDGVATNPPPPTVRIGSHRLGLDRRFALIAGPCVIESRDLVFRVAETLRGVTDRLGVPFVFKASFDKANRTSGRAFRGPGLDEGLRILDDVRRALDVPVLTDVHEPDQVPVVAQVVDVVQTPAFLVRQTDLLVAAARSGKPVHVKKGQYLAPADMLHVVDKLRAAGADGRVLVCERGACFGYHDLVVDFRSLGELRRTGCPVVFDATHSVQSPGARDGASGGQVRHVPLLARAAIAAGVSGLFLETHPSPPDAWSDAATSVPLHLVERLLAPLIELDAAVKAAPAPWPEDLPELAEDPS